MGKSVLRILAIVVVFAVGVVGVAALALPWLVSTQTVRTAIERELGSFFGTSAELGQKTELVIFPRPRARLSDVQITAPDGETAILTVESLETDIGLAGLLRGRPQFSSFRLVRPHMRLVQDETGQIDWEAATGRVGRLISTLNESATEEARDRVLAAEGGRLGSISTEGGRLTILDTEGMIVEDVTSIDGQINWPSIMSPVSLSADAIWRGTAGHIEFDTDVPVAFFGDTPTPTRLSIESEIGNIVFDGSANIGALFFADGTMQFSTPSMQALMSIAGTDMAPGRALGQVELSGPVRIAQRRIQFDGLDLSVDGNSGTGVLEIALSQADAEPALTGTLDFQSLDIYAFLSAFVDLSQLPMDEETRVEDIVSRIRIDLRISAADASFEQLQLTELAATAQVSDEVAIFDIGDAAAYGGHVQARLALTEGEDGERVEIILSGQAVDSAAIDSMFSLPETLPRGRGNFSVAINAPIADRYSAARAAKGTVSIEMNDGIMPGFGFDALIEQRETGRYFSLDPDMGGDTFSTARIYGDVDDGLLTLRDTTISYPSGDVTLTGIVSLSTGSLALTAAARSRTANEGEPPEHDAQFFVGGSWNRPFATPVLPPAFQID